MVVLLLVIVSFFSLTVSEYATIVDFKSHVYNPSVATISYEVVNGSFLNYNLTLLKVSNTAEVLCSMSVKKAQKKNRMTSLLQWRHSNYCKFLAIYKSDRILNHLFSHMVQSSFLTSCPFREGFYYLKNAYFDVGLLQNILPHGKYHIHLEISQIEDGIDRVIGNFLKLYI